MTEHAQIHTHTHTHTQNLPQVQCLVQEAVE